jgi:hypothetical protein
VRGPVLYSGALLAKVIEKEEAMADVVNASPTKTFFLEMFTRDITLEDAILDLIDNAIDALSRTRNIDLSVYYSKGNGTPPLPVEENRENLTPAKIDVSYSNDTFKIVDNCGGISYQDAQEEVFRFGRISARENLGLSVYGVGLKRAIFKLGKKITVESKTKEEGWVVNIDVNEWSKSDAEWSFPIEKKEAAGTDDDAGTSITVTDLNPEVTMRFNDGTLGAALKQAVATTYPLFLGEHVSISINQVAVKPQLMSIAVSKDIGPSYLRFKEGDVDVIITAGLAERIDHEWSQDRAGWYILCNSRVVVWADKTDLTGWGLISPQFHTKFRGFIGLVFFFSKAPEDLPWTTTKRGLNKESKVYQLATKKMALAGRPVLDFLNKISSGYSDQISQGQVIASLRALPLTDVFGKAEGKFSVSPAVMKKVSTVRIQYSATLEEIEKVKTCLKNPMLSYGAIGRHALDYFIEQECP